MNYRVIAKASALFLGGIILIGMCGCIFYSFRIRWQAQACLDALQKLHVGTSTMEDARKVLAPFHRFEKDGTTSISGKEYPIHTYSIDNKGFHLLGIFSPTRFGTGLIFRNGIVIDKGAGFTQENRIPKVSYIVRTRETVPGLMQNFSLESNPSGMIVGVWDPSSKLDVFLDTRASEADRKAAYNYNLGCFTSIFGCRGVYQILPGVEHYGAK